MIEFLQSVPAGTLATSLDGQPYQSTLLFTYEPTLHAIYLHTARRGRVWENVQAGAPACFTAYQMGRLLPANTALEFSVEYQSVVAFGTLCLIDDSTEAEHALQLLLDKCFPHLHSGSDYSPINSSELSATAVYRLNVEEWSGKRKSVASNYPGAFFHGDIPKV